MDNQEAIAFAALWASVHTLRFMTNRGLISPNEVDEAYGSIIEAVQMGDADYAARVESRLAVTFSEMRKWAEERWIGKEQTNPR